ncbi:hypothetical protein H9P43_000600 [Blastocladiella emersonii ATCC 22665]|nr:hypothetical protein H9P43_000600 [Blastocladiella emersonii ATCC 22665]
MANAQVTQGLQDVLTDMLEELEIASNPSLSRPGSDASSSSSLGRYSSQVTTRSSRSSSSSYSRHCDFSSMIAMWHSPPPPRGASVAERVSPNYGCLAAPVHEESKPHAWPACSRAIDELISSEKTYFDMLFTLVNLFLRPLKRAVQQHHGKHPILPATDVARIFSNVEEIFGLHATLLQGLQRQASPAEHPVERVARALADVLPYLKAYHAYAINYATAVETYEACRRSHPAFAKFIETCHADPRLNQLELPAYLILPIQRVPRYVLLLERALEDTHPLYPAHAPLASCLGGMHDLASNLDHAVSDHRAQLKVAEIQRALMAGTFNPRRVEAVRALASPARRFVCHGPVRARPPASTAGESEAEKTARLPAAPLPSTAAMSAATPFTMAAMSSLPLFEPMKKGKKQVQKAPSKLNLWAKLTRSGSRTSSSGSDVDDEFGFTSEYDSHALEVLSTAAAGAPDLVHLFLFSDLLVVARPLPEERYEYLYQIDLRGVVLVSAPPPSALGVINSAPLAAQPMYVALPPTPVQLQVHNLDASRSSVLDLAYYPGSREDSRGWHNALRTALDELNFGVAHSATGASVATHPGAIVVRRIRSRNHVGGSVSTTSLSSCPSSPTSSAPPTPTGPLPRMLGMHQSASASSLSSIASSNYSFGSVSPRRGRTPPSTPTVPAHPAATLDQLPIMPTRGPPTPRLHAPTLDRMAAVPYSHRLREGRRLGQFFTGSEPDLHRAAAQAERPRWIEPGRSSC